MSDLIAAIATPPGPGGVGILRLSGPGAHRAASQVFHPQGPLPLDRAPDRQLLYGTLHDPAGALLDTGLAFISRAPHSYTGEDTAELQCHGAPVVLSLVLDALYAAGARPARPGEFTQRAFLNGKLDLTQAEAVIDLIDAETSSAARQAAGQLAGALSRRVEESYRGLTDIMAHFCAVLDYPDEDIDPFRTQQLQENLTAQREALAALLATGRRGQRLTRGVSCALIGRPNAGKSSLLNALAGYDRAIVTHLPGTTRDTIEVTVELGGFPFRLVDTAGLRESDDPIEQLGAQRSRQAMDQADLLLVVWDGTHPPTGEDQELLAQALARADTILAVNKADLPGYTLPAPSPPSAPHTLTTVALSARTGQGLDRLEAALSARAEAAFPLTGQAAAGQLLTNQRQTDAVRRALAAVDRAGQALAAGVTPDALLTDVEQALAALGELTGRTVREDITQRIFERFCVGK